MKYNIISNAIINEKEDGTKSYTFVERAICTPSNLATKNASAKEKAEKVERFENCLVYALETEISARFSAKIEKMKEETEEEKQEKQEAKELLKAYDLQIRSGAAYLALTDQEKTFIQALVWACIGNKDKQDKIREEVKALTPLITKAANAFVKGEDLSLRELKTALDKACNYYLQTGSGSKLFINQKARFTDEATKELLLRCKKDVKWTDKGIEGIDVFKNITRIFQTALNLQLAEKFNFAVKIEEDAASAKNIKKKPSGKKKADKKTEDKKTDKK